MQLVRRCGPAIGVTLLLGVFLSGCSSAKKAESTGHPRDSTAAPTSVSASPTPSPAPASPFEDDPAVIALRAWASQLAKTVNSGTLDDPALDALVMSNVRPLISKAFAGSIGHRYPGPLPFSPIQITKKTGAEHNVNICVVSNGFAVDPATGKAAGSRKVLPIDAGADLVNGRWTISGFYDGKFSCEGIQIPAPTW